MDRRTPDRRTDGQTDRRTDAGRTDGQTDGHRTDGRTGAGRTDGRAPDGQMDARAPDGHIALYLYRYSKSQQVNVASWLCRDLTVRNLTNYLHKKYKGRGAYVARALNLPVLSLQYMVYLAALVPLAPRLSHGHVEACLKR